MALLRVDLWSAKSLQIYFPAVYTAFVALQYQDSGNVILSAVTLGAYFNYSLQQLLFVVAVNGATNEYYPLSNLRA